MTHEKILTRDEVMAQLKIGRTVFYKLIRNGDLKSYKDGNRIKVPADSVTEYIVRKMERAC